MQLSRIDPDDLEPLFDQLMRANFHREQPDGARSGVPDTAGPNVVRLLNRRASPARCWAPSLSLPAADHFSGHIGHASARCFGAEPQADQPAAV